MKALLVVDLQNDFLPGGALQVKDSDSIIPIINQIQTKFDLVIASQDWHPKTHQSFASAHQGKKLFEQIDLNGLNQVLWPDHCVQNTPGAEFSPKWDSRLVSAIFRKGMNPQIDSYSAFFDNGHLQSTGLLGYLQHMNVTELYVCGLAADYCVYYSCMDAAKAKIKTYFLDFASKAISQQTLQEVYQSLKNANVEIVKSQQSLFLD
ncbi:bifunctional nicotinamidase/pyrazinamidase [Myroides sp. LJL119]